jgi:tripartite-type tricarboxylate transporter receptor subunit TctC
MARLLLASCLLAAALLLPQESPAQAYPSKPIRIIVPFPAGGIADVFARIIGARFSAAWGQPVVVENRAGAGGNIGADAVAKAPADGYTLVMGNVGTHAVNASLFRNLPYDPVRDFTPVALVMEAESLLAVHPSVGADTPTQLIALARANPGKLTFGSAGPGTAGHLAGELFKSMARVDITHVPYKGSVPAITDLLAGQTAMVFATMPTVLPYVKAGKLKGLAVLGLQRSAAAPEIPTLDESGLKGFEVNNWIGIFGPKGMPRDVTLKLNGAIVELMKTPEVQTRLLNEGARFTATTPERFAAFVGAEAAKWGKLIREVGVKVD